jgi:hypothetical protein
MDKAIATESGSVTSALAELIQKGGDAQGMDFIAVIGIASMRHLIKED